MADKRQKIKTGKLSDSLIFSARLYRSRMTRAFASLNLYTGQDTLLKCLAKNNGQTMGELAKRLSVRPPTVTKMVSRMSAQDLVERRVSPDDNRISHVFVTNLGTTLLKKIKNTRKKVEKSVFDKITDNDRRKLNRLLKKVSKNLEKLDKPKK